MWRKPNEAKPSSQPVSAPGSVPNQTKVVSPATPPVEFQPSVSPAPIAQASIQQAVPAPPPIISAPINKPPVSRDAATLSRVGSGLKIRGELSGTADLLVDGELQGKISLGSSRVTVGQSGRVQADIEACDIVVEGSVQGNLKAGESVHLSSTSRVQGSILTPRIGIDDGARLRGKVEMLRGSEGGSSSATEPAIDSDILRPVHARGKEA